MFEQLLWVSIIHDTNKDIKAKCLQTVVNNMREIRRERPSTLKPGSQESLSGKVTFKLRTGRRAGASYLGAQGRAFCRGQRRARAEALRWPESSVVWVLTKEL